MKALSLIHILKRKSKLEPNTKSLILCMTGLSQKKNMLVNNKELDKEDEETFKESDIGLGSESPSIFSMISFDDAEQSLHFQEFL